MVLKKLVKTRLIFYYLLIGIMKAYPMRTKSTNMTFKPIQAPPSGHRPLTNQREQNGCAYVWLWPEIKVYYFIIIIINVVKFAYFVTAGSASLTQLQAQVLVS